MTSIRLPDYDPTNYGNEPGQGPLRVGGKQVSGDTATNATANLPSTPIKAVEAQSTALKLVRDLEGGQIQVKAQGSAYLPKAPGEEYLNYQDRLARSVFYNAFMQTVQGLTGFIFRRDPQLEEDTPEVFKADWENIDNAGTHGDVFARDITQDALIAGHAAILVEYPVTGGTQNAAEEAEIRPYWIPIRKDDIVSWRTASIKGRTVLTQLVIRESTMVPEGAFGEKEQLRYRVFYNAEGQVGFALLEETKERKVIVVDQGIYPTQDEIPVAEITTSGRKSMFESQPPLIDLAHLNVAYYQMWSDHATSTHMTNVPIIFTAGVPMTDEQGNALVIGPNSGIHADDPSAKAEYVSHDGAALAESRAFMSDVKAEMATVGLSMLSPDKRTAETAEGKRIDKSSQDSKLGVTARGSQDGLERAAVFHLKYYRIDQPISIKVNRDFENLALSAQEISAYAGLVSQGLLSIETLWARLLEGNALPEDFDEDEERAKIEAQRAIEEAQAQVEFERQQEAMKNNPRQQPPNGMAA